MFNRSTSKFIQEIKLNIGTFLGEEKDEDVFIVLREPKTEWMIKFTKLGENDTEAQIDAFKELLPSLIIKHNFTEDGEKLMSTDGVTEVLFESLPLTQYVMQEYFSAPFFTQQRKTK